MALGSIKKGDMIRVLSGKDRGKIAKVGRVLPEEHKVVVEGVNIKKRHARPKKQGEKGQIIQISLPIDFSNVMLVCPACKKPQRPKRELRGEKKVRVCRKCEAEIK